MSEKSILSNIGDNTQVLVFFDYQPKEKATNDYPGCDSEVTITNIIIGGIVINNIMEDLNAKCLDRLKMECFEFIEND